jgi:hypothetical protein
MQGVTTLRIKQYGEYQLSIINNSRESQILPEIKGAWKEPICEKIRQKSRWTVPESENSYGIRNNQIQLDAIIIFRSKLVTPFHINPNCHYSPRGKPEYYAGELTALGGSLADLPVDPQLGKVRLPCFLLCLLVHSVKCYGFSLWYHEVHLKEEKYIK